MNKKNNHLMFLVRCALIAALYALISLLLAPFNFGPLQFRASEALSVLVRFTPAAPLGLFVGCIITNIISPYGLLDAVLGSLATLCAAHIARRIKNKYLALLPFVVINAIVVSFVICYSAGSMQLYLINALYLALSEAGSVYLIGVPIMLLIEKNEKLKGFIER